MLLIPYFNMNLYVFMLFLLLALGHGSAHADSMEPKMRNKRGVFSVVPRVRKDTKATRRPWPTLLCSKR